MASTGGAAHPGLFLQPPSCIQAPDVVLVSCFLHFLRKNAGLASQLLLAVPQGPLQAAQPEPSRLPRRRRRRPRPRPRPLPGLLQAPIPSGALLQQAPQDPPTLWDHPLCRRPQLCHHRAGRRSDRYLLRSSCKYGSQQYDFLHDLSLPPRSFQADKLQGYCLAAIDWPAWLRRRWKQSLRSTGQ